MCVCKCASLCVCVCVRRPLINHSLLPQKCALQRRPTRDHQSAASANTRATGKLASGARRSGADYITGTDALAIAVLLCLLSFVYLDGIYHRGDAYRGNRSFGLQLGKFLPKRRSIYNKDNEGSSFIKERIL